MSRLNGLTAIWLLVLVGAAPLPFGGNRPFLWALWALLIAATATFYSLQLALRGAAYRVPLSRFGWLGLAYLPLCSALVLQLVPFGGFAFNLPDGSTLTSKTASLAPGQTLLMLLRWCTFGLLFFLVAQVSTNRGRARQLLAAIVFITAGFSILGLVFLTLLGDTFFGIEKLAHLGSATASFTNRDSFATFLAFGLVTGSALLAEAIVPSALPGRVARWGNLLRSRVPLYAIAMLIIATGLIATQSRMGVFAGGLASLVIFVAGLARAGVSRRAVLAFAIAGLLAGIALLLVLGGSLLERVGGIEVDADTRFQLYDQIRQMIFARPWLGYGGGSFEIAFPLFHRPPVSTDVTWDHGHSTYLTMWLELGLVAGSLPLLLVLGLAIKAIRDVVRTARDWLPPLASIGVVLVAAVHSTVDYGLEIAGNAYLLVTILALGFGSLASKRQPGAPVIDAERKVQ